MDEKLLNIVFDEFTQADSSNNKQFKGTGLGLSIVKMYLQIMDSEIQVESTSGIGSRFWFELPLIEDYARLLIVEDDDFGRMMFNLIRVGS